MENIRKAAVSGHFYPGDKKSLIDYLNRTVKNPEKSADAVAVICPHAGYVYSGMVAAKVYAKVKIPETVVIIGPNHQGYGEPFALMKEGSWQMPLGIVDIDTALSEKILKKSRYLQEDSVAHTAEHSIEVQVPFLRYLNEKVRIVPIVISGYPDVPAWIEIGTAIAKAVKETGKKVLIAASSDFTHYESRKEAEEKDGYAIEAITAMNEMLFIERVDEKNISHMRICTDIHRHGRRKRTWSENRKSRRV